MRYLIISSSKNLIIYLFSVIVYVNIKYLFQKSDIWPDCLQENLEKLYFFMYRIIRRIFFFLKFYLN